MKTVVNVWAVLAVLGVSACTSIDMATYEDERIYAELEMNDPRQITLTIDNQSQAGLTLDQSGARYTRYSQESPLTALDETAYGTDVPPLRVPAGSRGNRNFALEPAVTVTSAKRTVNKWLPEDTSALGFRFYYQADGEEWPLVFPDPQERELVGKVKISIDIAMPFFYTIPERRQRIYDQALIQARNAFGEGGRELRLVNLRYDSKVSGFVEKATLNADVIAEGTE
jgi:hypothetical protein